MPIHGGLGLCVSGHTPASLPALGIKSKLHTRVHKALSLWQFLPFQSHGTALPCSPCSSPGVDKLQQRSVRCWWNAARTFFCVACVSFHAAVAELGGWGRDCGPQCHSGTPNGMGPGKWGLIVAPRRRNGLVHQLAIFAMCLGGLETATALTIVITTPVPTKGPRHTVELVTSGHTFQKNTDFTNLIWHFKLVIWCFD